MKLSIVIPAYNEEASIQRTISTVADYIRASLLDSEIIVVDDGSRDHTGNIVQNLLSTCPLRFIKLSTNQGKGAAVRAGALAATGEYVLFMDADMSTSIQQYDALYRALIDGADIAIASRYVTGSHVAVSQPWFRVVLGRVANAIVRVILLPGIYDTQCGFKVFTRESAMELFSLQRMNRWSFDLELLVLARRLGYMIAEVPVVWRDCQERHSRFHAVRDAWGMVADTARVMFALVTRQYGDLDRHKKIR